MSQLCLRFKVPSLKTSFLATLNCKNFTAFNLLSFISHNPAHRSSGCSASAQKCSRFLCAFIFGLCLSFIAQLSFADTKQPNIRELDRMFTTRAERAQLDALRDRMRGMSGAEMPVAENSVSSSPLNVEMQGIMQREKGKNVTWINGQSTLNDNIIDDHIRVAGQPQALRGANVTIEGQSVRLKPGQVWRQENGQVVESYKTKVAKPVTKGADEAAQNVQTENNIWKAVSAITKPETKATEKPETETTAPKP